MTNNNITIQERTKFFAVRSIKAYSRMINNKNFNEPVVVIAKQFLCSSTCIGANCLVKTVKYSKENSRNF